MKCFFIFEVGIIAPKLGSSVSVVCLIIFTAIIHHRCWG